MHIQGGRRLEVASKIRHRLRKALGVLLKLLDLSGRVRRARRRDGRHDLGFELLLVLLERDMSPFVVTFRLPAADLPSAWALCSTLSKNFFRIF